MSAKDSLLLRCLENEWLVADLASLPSSEEEALIL